MAIGTSSVRGVSGAGASESNPRTGQAALLQHFQGVAEVAHFDHRHEVERAGGRFRHDAGFARRVACRRDHRVGAKGAGGAQDRADIVRVGQLVEDHDELGLGQMSLRPKRLTGSTSSATPWCTASAPSSRSSSFGVVSVGLHLTSRAAFAEANQRVWRNQQVTFSRRGLSSAARTVCRP